MGEKKLVDLLDDEKLKDVCVDLEETIRKHGLHKSPETCEMLFLYMLDVIKGWNRERTARQFIQDASRIEFPTISYR